MRFLELSEALEHLGMVQAPPGLGVMLDAACDVVEDWCGPIGVRDVSETVTPSPSGVVVLGSPFASVVSVSPTPAAVVADGPAGVLTVTGVSSPVVVAYRAGFEVAPAWARLAALVILEHLWRTRRGAGAGGRRTVDDVAVPGAGYLVPNQAATLMEPHRLVRVG